MQSTEPVRPSRRFQRPTLSALTLNLIVIAYLLAVLNGGFWSRAGTVFAGSPLSLVIFGLAVAALMLAIQSLVTLPWLHRPALALLIITAAVAEHFRRAYGVIIDREMVQNAMLTTANESRHLFSLTFIRDIVLTGVLPAALVFVPRVRPVDWRHRLWRYPVMVVVSLALVVGLLMTNFKTYSAAIREHRDMMGSQQPSATLAAVLRYAKQELVTAQIDAAPLGTDAKPGPHLAAADKPVLLVVFAGETARAQNYGLNGYARDTSPQLAGMDIVNYPDTSSCGTSTAVSLPCMFSALNRDEYSQKRFRGQENLLDVLSHAGLDVQWIDNNTGDQGIGARTGARRLDVTADATACASGECTDAVFLPILRDIMATMTQDTVVVLHMIGSHGPAYYLRYPPEAEAFTPACRSSSFADCTIPQIVNAYDNSIRYTDQILAESIRMMEAQDRVIPAMFYMSDHGESLGEGGLYLHAAPMFLAPETQTKVPFTLWLSPRFQTVMGVDHACLRREANTPKSHDNMFHTVLGLMDIQTSVHKAELDLTSPCRTGG